MNICILGPLRVDAHGVRLTHQDFGGTKPRELLGLLLLARGRPMTKDALAEGLWPTRRPKNIGGTLETYVSGLRRVLFTDRSVARQVLRTGAGAYAFDTTAVTLDIDRFDALVKRANAPGRDHAALLTEATELIRGDLLEDLGEAPWLMAERELYRDRGTRALLSLSEAHLAQGAWVAALDAAEAALRIRRFSEEATRLTMLAYHAMGHDDAARLAFARAQERLASELDTDPMTETEDLAGAISAGVPPAELLAEFGIHPVHDERGVSNGPVHVVDGDRRDPERRLPFLGRVEELERVRDHIEASRSGDLRVVAVRANRGLGKTAFLRQLERSTTGAVGRQTYTVADQERPALPMAMALCAALAGGTGADDAMAFAMSPNVGDDPSALEQLCAVIETHAPIVLLLDDFEWTDLATITAISWLTREAPDLPLTIVAAERLRHRRSSRLVDLVTVDEEIQLGPLRPEVVTADVGPDLLERTGGVPTLLADSVRWERGGGTGPSPSLRSEVLRSVRGLSSAHRRLLRVLAARHDGADPFELSEYGGMSPVDAVAALDELVDIEVLVASGSHYRFRAPIVGDVIAGMLPEQRHRVEPSPIRRGRAGATG